MLNFLFLSGGMALILFSAGWLVEGASSVAKKAGISDLVIGLTVVALGTSAPELSVNIFSALSGATDIAFGNILGSNISNILLILGVSSIIYPLRIGADTKWKEIPFSLLAALVLGIMANDVMIDGSKNGDFLTRADGLLLLSFFIIFLAYTFFVALKGNIDHSEPEEEVKTVPVHKSILLIICGLAGLFIGGKYLVDGAVNIARIIGLSERVIGITIIAVGTSLPELATSAVAAWKKKADIAVGNVIGSNIFNIFLILGVTSVICPVSANSGINVDIGMVIFASLILFITAYTFKRSSIDRVEGGIFVAVYFSYITYLLLL